MLTTLRSNLRSKMIAFQTAVWEKAGRYTSIQKRRILLSLMIAVVLIAWMLLRFAWAFLAAVINAVPDQDDFDREQAEREEIDMFGRKFDDPFFGYTVNDVTVLSEMERDAMKDGL